jgi:hypothetical protein
VASVGKAHAEHKGLAGVVFPLSVGLGIFSYSVLYYGWLAVRGYNAVFDFSGTQSNPSWGPGKIRFLDTLLPSRLPLLMQWLAAGPERGAPPYTPPSSKTPSGPGTGAPLGGPPKSGSGLPPDFYNY